MTIHCPTHGEVERFHRDGDRVWCRCGLEANMVEAVLARPANSRKAAKAVPSLEDGANGVTTTHDLTEDDDAGDS